MQVLVPGIPQRWSDVHTAGEAPLVFSIDGVFTPDECHGMIARIEASTPEDAPISTARGFEMRPDIRNNQRVMFDDHTLAAELFTRILSALPSPLKGRRAHGINERFRCYRYQPGQRFAPHYDGAFRRSATECSELTFMVYLNEDFTGGQTSFLDFDLAVTPRTGTALLFHHQLLHEGGKVLTGTKYVLRSDVMYSERLAP